jgi:uncharacterized cupredoxin-like copper-binding protein
MLLRLLPVVLVMALVGCAGPGAPAKPASSQASSAAPAPAKAPGPYVANGQTDGSSGKVALEGFDTMKFSPNTVVKVKPGQQVSVDLKNSGATIHDIYSPALGLTNAVVVNPGRTGTATFTAPSAAGTYQFWCHQPGHGEAGMTGQVVVE